jgi:hypothetical protein
MRHTVHGRGARARRARRACSARGVARIAPAAIVIGGVVALGLGVLLATVLRIGGDSVAAPGVAIVACAAGGWAAGWTAKTAGARHGLGAWVLAALVTILTAAGGIFPALSGTGGESFPGPGDGLLFGLVLVLGSLGSATAGGWAGAQRPE